MEKRLVKEIKGKYCAVKDGPCVEPCVFFRSKTVPEYNGSAVLHFNVYERCALAND